MNKKKIIWLVTILSMISIGLIQCLWLSNLFRIKKLDYEKDATNLLSSSIEFWNQKFIAYDFSQFDPRPGFTFDSEKNEIIIYGIEGVDKVNYNDSLDTYNSLFAKINYDLYVFMNNDSNALINDLFKQALFQRGLNEDYYLCIKDENSGNIISDFGNIEIKNKISTKSIQLGVIHNHTITAYLDYPYKDFFSSMSWILIWTFLLLGILTFCILYQISLMLEDRRINRKRETFMSAMIHDLKSPLACAMINFGDMVDGSTNLTEEQVDIIIYNRERIGKMCMDVQRALATWKEGLTINWDDFSLKKAMEALIRQYIILNKNLNIDFELNFNLEDEIVTGDSSHIPNVVNNLIDNAIKYTVGRPKIIINCYDEGKFFVISVKDNGIGIPPESIKKIFKRFYRASSGKEMNVEGQGIGLSYVWDVVQEHHAFIDVKSTVGVGSEFIIKFVKFKH